MDSELLSVAEELIEIFKNSVGQTRAELLENSKMSFEGSQKPILVLRGLQKLVFDRTVFDTSTDEKFTNFREKVFAKTSEFFSTQNFGNFTEFKAKIESAFSPQKYKEISAKLYSDLPEFQEVSKFKTLTPELLLNRYNCAQIQGLLIHCNQLEITVSDSAPKKLRQLFKFLRFFQLLAKVQRLNKNTFKIFVDGPLNLFYRTQKYGLNLANFFPSLLNQEKWQLVAKVQLKNRKVYELNLDQTCGIKPISQIFLAYVPKEIQMFEKLFNEKNSDWEISTTSNFVSIEGEAYCFPDFSLKHKNGTKFFLEIFHAWHSSHFSERLQTLNHNSPKLILGIAQNLLKDPFILHSIESSEYFREFGFTFREMPTVSKVSKILQKFE